MRKFYHNRSGQNIIEYALIITLVLTGIIVMGPTIIRSWNAVVKGYDDDIQDSYNDPLDAAPPGGVIVDCQCQMEAPCDTPPCCGMGGCASTKDSLVEYCEPLGCRDTEPICSPHVDCCGPPVPGIAPDDCGKGICAPNEIEATKICGNGIKKPDCINFLGCINSCVDASNVPIDFEDFESNPNLYAGRCPLDDENLSTNTLYTTVLKGDCSPGMGTRPKCELQCARGIVPAFSNASCDCPPGMRFTTTAAHNIDHDGFGCGACPFGSTDRCDSANPSQCDFWCLPDPLWRDVYTWNTDVGGSWQCPGDLSADPGCLDEARTTQNAKPYCRGGHLIPSGDYAWAMHPVEGGLCEIIPPCEPLSFFSYLENPTLSQRKCWVYENSLTGGCFASEQSNRADEAECERNSRNRILALTSYNIINVINHGQNSQDIYSCVDNADVLFEFVLDNCSSPPGDCEAAGGICQAGSCPPGRIPGPGLYNDCADICCVADWQGR